MKIGSEAHKIFFCEQFIDSYTEFDPETLPWPELDPPALQRLRDVPFWQEVRHTERRAGAIVAAFTETIADPLVRQAVALQGREEARHAKLLAVMIERYGIDAPEQPLEPLNRDLESGFIDFGFGECLDSLTLGVPALLGWQIIEARRVFEPVSELLSTSVRRSSDHRSNLSNAADRGAGTAS